MTTCKRCGAPLPDQSRSRGRKRTYCSAACQGGRVTPAEGITGVSVHQRHNEIAKRAADIQRDPELRAQMDRLRRGQIDRVPVRVKLARIQSERTAQAWRRACETYLAAHPDADLRRVPAADVVRFGRGGR